MGAGRLLLRLDTGAVVGFGHVNDRIAPGTPVPAGSEIATIGNNGGNSHVEFMYDATGAGAPYYYKRASFPPPPPPPPPPVGTAVGCPRHTWTAGGGTSANPCTVLTNYMHGASGGGVAASGLGVAFQANTGNLWTVGPGGAGDLHLGMVAGTSPSISSTGEVAFEANTTDLGTVGPGGAGDLHLGMMKGTSPGLPRIRVRSRHLTDSASSAGDSPLVPMCASNRQTDRPFGEPLELAYV
jgi:hypothetical protein